jgi:hypothetical protein
MGRLHREQQASRFQNRGFLQQQKLVTYPDPNSDSYQAWVGEEVRDETAVMRSKEMRDVETQYCRLVQGMHCTTRAWPFRPCAAAKVERGPCRGPYGCVFNPRNACNGITTDRFSAWEVSLHHAVRRNKPASWDLRSSLIPHSYVQIVLLMARQCLSGDTYSALRLCLPRAPSWEVMPALGTDAASLL